MKSEDVGNIKDYLNSSSGKFFCFNYTHRMYVLSNLINKNNHVKYKFLAFLKENYSFINTHNIKNIKILFHSSRIDNKNVSMALCTRSSTACSTLHKTKLNSHASLSSITVRIFADYLKYLHMFIYKDKPFDPWDNLQLGLTS